AGLFSASLTAFLIESYKTLVPDSGDMTVLLLSQISQQLAASSNGTAFNFVAPVPFSPLASSLVCNILWFISLGLSLTCALVATLLEQWARDFLHKTETRSAPVIRARVFSYLYYGLKKFGMHTVVEIIPLLLHASLLFFFGGLVAFLLPINTVVTAVAAAMLGTVTLVYAILTLLPLSHPDCPYRTPLSGGFWNLRTSLQRFFPWEGASAKTMVDSVFRGATTPSIERHLRDEKALVWTVKSLTDDTELEPLLDALPDVLWDSTDRRRLYDGQIRRIIDDPGSNLVVRLLDFEYGCYSGVLPPEVATRRQISCYKAIWALSTLSTPDDVVHIPFRSVVPPDPEVGPYFSSARAVQAWTRLARAKVPLDRILALLKTYISAATTNQPPNSDLIQRIRLCFRDPRIYQFSPNDQWSQFSHEQPAETLSMVAQSLVDEITGLPLQILLDYLDHANMLNNIPYQFDPTRRLISPPPGAVLSDVALRRVEAQMERVVYRHLRQFQEAAELIWLDKVCWRIVSYWEPRERNRSLPWAVIEYFSSRNCDDAVRGALLWIPRRAWEQIPQTLLEAPSISSHTARSPWDALTMVLTAVWRLCLEYPTLLEQDTEWIDVPTWKAILVAVSQTQHQFFTPCVVVMVKRAALRGLDQAVGTLTAENLVSRFNQPILLAPPPPTISGFTVDEARDEQTRIELRRRYGEEGLNILTDFLEQCCANTVLTKSPETMKFVGDFDPRQGIQASTQLRFATAAKDLFAKNNTTLLEQFLNLSIWDYDRWYQSSSGNPWLDDPQARGLVRETFRAYVETLPHHSKLFAHVRELDKVLTHSETKPERVIG
ncbi:hypothetical protein C8R46DRAFT_1118564, partial [Mycena filopes]